MNKDSLSLRGGHTQKLAVIGFILGFALLSSPVQGQTALPLPRVNIGVDSTDNPQQFSSSIQVLLLLTILSLAPALLVMMTSFTRIIVVLSFLRHGLATQQMPSNQILAGLALFLTFFVMAPVWTQVNEQAVQPYLKEEITQREAYERGIAPVREFMYNETRKKDLRLMIGLSKMPKPENFAGVPTYVLIPAFVISELKTAFSMGFLLFIPFLVVDMVVASVLMAMGMMMLPPVMISLPFKVLLFVLVDGWNILVQSLVLSFS